jgi:hypothetical protein
MNGGSSTIRHTGEVTHRDSLDKSNRLRLLDLIVAQWSQSSNPDLVSALDDNPYILRDRSLLLDLAIEEYKALRSRRTDLDLDSHCRRFLRFGSSVQRSIFRRRTPRALIPLT